MGSIKGTVIKVELATANQLTKQIQEANGFTNNFLDGVSSAANGFATAAKKYEAIYKESLLTAEKAKDIGADAVYKDVMSTAEAAKRNAALCTSREAKLNSIFSMR